MDIEAASRTAEAAHRGQTRAHGAPYVEHPRAVLRFAETLAVATGFPLDDELRAIALLHDVIEDSDHTEESLLPVFGERVAATVALLSKPPKSNRHNKEDRSRAYWASMANADDGARLVKTADRLHNVFELPQTNDPARQKRYLLSTCDEVLPFAQAASPELARGLAAALNDAIHIAARLSGVPCPLSGEEPRLRGVYPIVDLHPDVEDDDVFALFDAACRGGARLVQLRAKGVSDRRALALATRAAEHAEKHGVTLVLNDRADLAQLTGAGGLHVGADDIPARRARQLVGPGVVVGTSTHTQAQLDAAVQEGGLDYVAFGPTFVSPTKQGHAEPTGTAALREAVRRSAVPVVAIGGITGDARMAEIAGAGASMGAVISAVVTAEDAAETTRRLGVAHAAALASTEEVDS